MGALKSHEIRVIVNATFRIGKTPFVWLVMEKEQLIKWKSDYPEDITEGAFIFPNKRRGPLTYPTVARQLSRLCKRSSITKYTSPQIFSYSRITHFFTAGSQGVDNNTHDVGSVDSRMIIRYTHLTGVDIDCEISKLYPAFP